MLVAVDKDFYLQKIKHIDGIASVATVALTLPAMQWS